MDGATKDVVECSIGTTDIKGAALRARPVGFVLRYRGQCASRALFMSGSGFWHGITPAILVLYPDFVALKEVELPKDSTTSKFSAR